MKRPPIHIPAHIEVPDVEQITTANGVRLFTIATESYEVVRVSFVFRAGSSWQAVPFSASATANCLSEGSRWGGKILTAQQIAEQLDFYGSFYDVSVDRDWVAITFVSLARHAAKTMDLAEEIVLHPAFPQSEVSAWCDKSRANLTLNRSKGDFIARENFLKALYGADHPYGKSYNETQYNELKISDLTDFYTRRYTASECFVVMSGAIDGNIQQRVEAIVLQLSPDKDMTQRVFSATPVPTRIDIPMESAVQASLRIGRVLFGRNHPDFTAMQLLLSVLGGYFGSRLMKVLRQEKGYTYGVGSGMANFDAGGHIAIATEVGSDVADEAIGLIFNEIERLKQEIIPEKELSLTKRMVIGETMRILDGPFGIADIVIENTQCNAPDNYLVLFLDEVRTMSAERLHDLAIKYLNDLTVVVVGSGAK